MSKIENFTAAQIEAVSKVLGDTVNGLKGDEIGYILQDLKIADPDAGATKWKRIFNALALAQNIYQGGNHTILFINRAMDPIKYVCSPDDFAWRRDKLNLALVLCGYKITDSGKVARTKAEATLLGAQARAGKLKSILDSRGTHQEVYKYCRAELLHDNYFHAVFEAIKGLAQRVREMSGSNADGAELVNYVFSTKNPVITINSLNTETEISEQKGISNLMIGLFGTIRNPSAHSPKIIWSMPEQDAIDIFGLVSFLHRKLDSSVRR